MSFAVAKTMATALFSSMLVYYNDIYHNIALKDILKFEKNLWQELVPVLLVSLTHYHFLNHYIGSLPDIALFFRSVQLPINEFHPSNQHIYIHCALLQDSPDSFDILILIYFLFQVLRQMEQEFFQLLH